ncbi:phosphate/phosphite/phosphonate ABC transporter substrate-binding protein [Aestuariispira insulae]|uniref:Phosphonate transport system substrate-binding protein n=1 Tax=Aestuariispira insulae TaxID=1461337 RepID=A0A3D9H5V7_9PROT|nr:phosphate/phosphite/phosphonate ABC transporter substrate-binding protein [Aestuariispira insulae]RED44880.1 phosphonate transport system substrate-binding protein [Aestuariispira insulae]
MFRKLIAAVTFAAALVGFQAAQADSKTIKLAVTDLVGMEELQREFGAFTKTLSDATGYEVEFLPVTNRTAAVEALRFKKVDFVLTGPAEYVVIKKRTDAKIVVGFSRPDYFAVLIARANSPYTLASQLKGQKVAMGSVGSTSKHLGPIQAMADAGLDPLNDVTVINTKIPVAWESLKKGDVAAIGMNHLKFLSLRDKEMENGGLQPGDFRVIGRGPDLPNDVLMVGTHVDPQVVDTVRKAFVEKSSDLIQAILQGEDNQKYKGMAFLDTIKDEDYDYVRAMYKTAGYPEYSDFIGN